MKVEVDRKPVRDGRLVKRNAHWIRFAGREDEKSLLRLGQIALILGLEDMALRLKISASMLFPECSGKLCDYR